VLAETGAAGLMIGRGAIRNPWLFEQIRQCRRGEPVRLPSGREVLAYIREIWEVQMTPEASESSQVQRMKKFMNFIGEGVVPAEDFLFQIRRVTSRQDFFRACEKHLDHDHAMTLEPREAMPKTLSHCHLIPGPLGEKVISDSL
jgi:tRNA-dihydrouridine synthase